MASRMLAFLSVGITRLSPIILLGVSNKYKSKIFEYDVNTNQWNKLIDLIKMAFPKSWSISSSFTAKMFQDVVSCEHIKGTDV